MVRRYTAYLLRRWQQTDGREWVELQHVATGERRRFQTLADALAWIEASGRQHTVPGVSVPPRAVAGRDPPATDA